jgi:argininosuccinate lyase
MADSRIDDAGAHKLWGGRFVGLSSPELETANRSIDVDFRLWPYDIKLSKVWAAALATAGVLATDDAKALERGLEEVSHRLANGERPEPADEDVHTLIDRLLHGQVGSVASRLHTGRSRNDQVATATRLWTLDACARLDAMLRNLQRTMLVQAEALENDVMPAYTHLQRAQPVSGAHWMLSHFWPIARDRRRLETAAESTAVLPLGSGAIAGSSFPVDRAAIGDALGFRTVSDNSIDAVGDRDFIAEVLFALALLGVHLSRLAEDLILFGSSEFSFVRFGDSYSTGSSMMPQKRNPDPLELARGSGARVLGDLVALLGTIKGLPSGYNKDLQEDKRFLFDAVDGMTRLLPAVTGSLAALVFNRERMRAAVTSTLMATDLADYLVRKHVTFREAHGAVGGLVREAEEKGVELTELPFASFKTASPVFEEDVFAELSPGASMAHRDLDGGTGPVAVRRQIQAAMETLATKE